MSTFIRRVQAISLFASGLAVSAQATTFITNISNQTWALVTVADGAPARKGGTPTRLSEGPDKDQQGRQKEVWLEPGLSLEVKPRTTLAIDLYDSMRSQSSVRFSLVDHQGRNPHLVALALGYAESSGGAGPVRNHTRKLIYPADMATSSRDALYRVAKVEGNRLLIAATGWSHLGSSGLSESGLSARAAAASSGPSVQASAASHAWPSSKPAAVLPPRTVSLPCLPGVCPMPAVSVQASSSPAASSGSGLLKASRMASHYLTIANESKQPMELTMANLEVPVLLRSRRLGRGQLTQTTLSTGEALAYVIPGGVTATLSCLGSEQQLPFSVPFALADGQGRMSSFLWTFPALSALGAAMPEPTLAQMEGAADGPLPLKGLQLDPGTAILTLKRGASSLAESSN